MSTNLPIKSSSRSGRFKKKLVPEDFLEKEAPVIQEKMTPFLHQLELGTVSCAEFTGIYILQVLAYRFPGTWLGSKTAKRVVDHERLKYSIAEIMPYFEPNIQKRLKGLTTLGEIFNLFALKSTPLTVNRSILNWSTNDYGLELMFRIPPPQEVLNQQKRGRRCVTIVLEKEKSRKYILGERDALGFCMHDLIHADHFYHNNNCYQGQLGFYGFLDFCLKRNHFQDHFLSSDFEAEFEYLIADMNAYAIHLMKCFKSALVHFHAEGDQFFSDWLNKMDLNEGEFKALKTLNSSQYNDLEDDEVLLKFLARFENAISHKRIY